MALRISALIDQKRVGFSVGNLADIKQLSMFSHILESEDSIYEIAITKEYILVTTQDPDLRNSVHAPLVKDDRSINNINAYDWNGRHRWNIGQIVGDIKAAFWGGTVTTKELLSAHAGIDPDKLVDGHELFVCTATNDRMYVIDLTDRQLIQVVQSR